MNPPESFPGIRVTEPRSVLLWDGQCGFCERSVRWFQRHARCSVQTQPVQDVLSRLPEPLRTAAVHEVLWIEPDGSAFGGSEAVIRALRASGHPFEAFALRASQPVSRWVYRSVARLRGAQASSCARR